MASCSQGDAQVNWHRVSGSNGLQRLQRKLLQIFEQEGVSAGRLVVCCKEMFCDFSGRSMKFIHKQTVLSTPVSRVAPAEYERIVPHCPTDPKLSALPVVVIRDFIADARLCRSDSNSDPTGKRSLTHGLRFRVLSAEPAARNKLRRCHRVAASHSAQLIRTTRNQMQRVNQ